MMRNRDAGLPEDLLRQITSRVRPACPDIPEDVFRMLVEELAMIRLRYDGKEPGPPLQ
jgi:hypothetical protein